MKNGSVINCNGQCCITDIPIDPHIKKFINDFMNHHKPFDNPEETIKEITKTFNENEKNFSNDEWDIIFINNIWEKNECDLYNLMMQADYLEMNVLYIICCTKLASVLLIKSYEKEKRDIKQNKEDIKKQKNKEKEEEDIKNK